MTFFARAKSPNAIVAYSIDYTDDLAGATISTSTWAIAGGTESDTGSTSTTTTVSLSGGSVTSPIVAVNTVTTSDGQTLVRSITIPIDNT